MLHKTHRPYTDLLISNHIFRITLHIESMRPRRFRRQLAVELYKILKPKLVQLGFVFKYAHRIIHSSVRPLDEYNSWLRDISLCSASKSHIKNWVGLELRLKRQAQGLTLKNVAKTAGIDFAQISLIERGLVRPRISSILKISHAINELSKAQKNPNLKKDMEERDLIGLNDKNDRAET